MALSPASWRAFGHRYLIALGLALVLAVGAVVVTNRVIDDKFQEIHRVPKLVVAAEGPAQAANFLIVGSDSRQFVENQEQQQAFGDPKVESGQRSDTIMVLHVDPAAKSSFLVSFPRDLLVNIPGRGRVKINGAFNDGPQKVIDTLNANFDLPISHYVEVNFTAFEGIVDAVGKIPVYFPQPARDTFSGLNIPSAGCLPLDGQTALQYVRSRHLQYQNPRTGEWDDASPRADLDRIVRQQNFIRRLASLASVKSGSNPLKAFDIADAIVPKLRVDGELSKGDIFRLVKAFRKVNPDDQNALRMETLPVVEGPSGSVVAKQPEAAQAVAALRTFGPQDTGPITAKPSQVRVRVLNASGVGGAAAAASGALQGFHFVPVGTGNVGAIESTEVRYRPGELDKARLVMRYTGGIGRPVEDSSIVDNDVTLVLAKDFAGILAVGKAAPSTSSTTAAKGAKSAKGAAPPAPVC